MEFAKIVKPASLFAALGLPASAQAATVIDVDYSPSGGAGTPITIGAAAAPQYSFARNPGLVFGTKTSLAANALNDPTARVGRPGMPADQLSAQTAITDTGFIDGFTDGDYSLAFDIAGTAYTGFATVDQQGQHISRISYDVAAVPEPETWALMVLGLGAAGAALRRRRQPAVVSA